MSRPRVGVLLEEGQVTVATLLGRDRFRLAMLRDDPTLPTRLAAALGKSSGRRSRLRAALDRQRVVVKTLELPSTSSARRRSILAFELERHLPFPAEHAEFDSIPAPTSRRAKATLTRVLIAAAPGRLVEDARRLLAAAGARPGSLTVACHDLPALLRRRPMVRRAVWIHRHRARADILLLSRGTLRLSRNVPAESETELAVEFARSLTLLNWTDCDAVWVSGDMNVALRTAVKAGEIRARVSRPPLKPAVERMLYQLEPERRGAGLLALAVAVGHRRPELDLMPVEVRPRRLSGAHSLAAGLAALALTAGAGLLAAQDHMQNRYLRLVMDEIRKLDPEVKSVERLGSELQLQRKLLTTIQSVEAGALHPLPVLKDLTEIMPRDAWLQSLTMDRQGVELTGQADAAGPLIPLLERSRWLEKVEFTAPVTRVLAQEQFRLRAGWETADRPPSGGAAEGSR
jgi:Tfp pilus assembly protein PilN